MAAFSTLTSSFTGATLDAAFQAGGFRTGGGATTFGPVQNGTVALSPGNPSVANEYRGFSTVSTYDLDADGVYTRVISTGNRVSGHEIQWAAYIDNNHAIGFYVNGGNIEAYIWDGSDSYPAAAGYSATTHAWWKAHYESGPNQVVLSFAPSSASDPPAPGDWVEFYRGTKPAGVAMTGMRWGFTDGSYSSVTTNTSEIDGFNGATVGGAATSIVRQMMQLHG